MANKKAAADKALSEAYRECGHALQKYCRVRLGDAADQTEDCVQEAFCVYYKKLLAGEEIEKPKAFLYRTADNMVKRARAAHYKDAVHLLPLEDAEAVEAASPDDLVSALDYDILKEKLLSELSPEEQLLYTRKYAERKSLKEIGLELSVPPTTVANRTSRLRTKIKHLSEELIESTLKGGG